MANNIRTLANQNFITKKEQWIKKDWDFCWRKKDNLKTFLIKSKFKEKDKKWI